MKSLYFKLFFLAAFAITGTACVATGSADANSAGKNTAVTQQTGEGAGATTNVPVDQSIRKIDFKNFEYEPFCAGEEPEKVTVKNKEFSKETKDKDSDFVDRFYFSVDEIVFGDVDGDNKEDAVITSTCNTGGTGQFSEGYVYMLKAGKAVLVDRIAGGDRAYGAIRSVKIQNGLVEVERNDPGENGGACCAQAAILTKYKWDGKKLVKSGSDVKRELYPAEKVSFAKGATKATMKVTVDEIKRYSFDAKAGQSISVSVNSPDVSVSLIKGEADITEGANGFNGRLTSSGEFVIQLQNSGEKPTEVSLTIEIK